MHKGCRCRGEQGAVERGQFVNKIDELSNMGEVEFELIF